MPEANRKKQCRVRYALGTVCGKSSAPYWVQDKGVLESVTAVEYAIEQCGHVLNVDGTILKQVTSRVECATVQYDTDQCSHVINVNDLVAVHVTQDVLGIENYRVVNGERNGIVVEPVPVIVVREVG